jgi:Tfp pilus assembly protein PilV
MTMQKISNSRFQISDFRSQISSLKSQTCGRRGFTLLEVTLAGLLLVVLMAITVQMLGWVVSERRAAERRQWAIQEAANVMERLVVQPWDELTSDVEEAIDLSPQASAVLPDAELQVTVAAEPDQPDAKRLSVAVRWRPRPDQAAVQVRLTSWVYPRKEAQP